MADRDGDRELAELVGSLPGAGGLDVPPSVERLRDLVDGPPGAAGPGGARGARRLAGRD